MNVIETNGLGKRYRRKWALRDCTLTIPGGHIVALVGPNGAGKTTMLTMSVGLTRPTEGAVTVLGGICAGSPGALDRIAFVAQDAPLYRNLPVGDMLHVAANLNRRWDQGYATHRLDRLAIPLRQKVGELSGGQKAQLALTIALARRPELLVLDEPVSALDVSVGAQVINLLRDLQKRYGLTCLFISHSMPLVRYLCDRVVVMQRGRVVESGTWSEVCDAPREIYTQQLLAATPELPVAS